MKISIDVVIPSFRPAVSFLLPLLQLTRPLAARVRFYVIIDDPGATIDPDLLAMHNGDDVFIVRNTMNMGAAAARNKGIEMGTGDWVLLLDDDVTADPGLLGTYTAAIQGQPGAIGFIGLINLPPATKPFTQAILATGAMDIFDVARRRATYAWGATANVLLNRRAMCAVRFSQQFPFAGGGEDVDMLLRIRELNNDTNYQCLPAAAVTHPWWGNEQPHFGRTFRYGMGNSWLGRLNPRYTYRDFLNTPETLLVSLLALIVALLFNPAAVGACLLFAGGVLLVEVLATGIQAVKRSQALGLSMLAYVIALRFVYETGVLWGHIRRGRIQGIGERFHDDGRVQRLFFYRLNTRKTVKWILYPVLFYFTFFHGHR